MCGLCGWIGGNEEPDGRAITIAMAQVLAHRGPDGSGVSRVGGNGASGWLGHRRLSVVDLTDAAAQPMASADGSVQIVFNGEVYNFKALRQRLASEGHRFASTGDTEVVLRAYEHWGPDFVEQLDGMFAIAVWDRRRSTLVLARDRVGKKPLFYAHRHGRLTFASEIKALGQVPWLRLHPRLDRLPHLLTFGYVPGPDTAYEAIVQLPPATLLEYRPREDRVVTRLYWTSIGGRKGKPDDEAVRAALAAATARRMVADVPLGSLLSGGIDSSLVTALMTRHASEPVRTFAIGFADEPSFDERRWARLVAGRLGTQHTEFVVRPDALALIDRLIWLHDGPFADSSAIPTFLVCALAREHVTVALTGDGGDEVFGGYERFAAARLATVAPPRAALLAGGMLRLLPRRNAPYNDIRRRFERFVARGDAPLIERYAGWMSVADRDQLAALLRPEAIPSDLIDSLTTAYATPADGSALDRLLFANLATYLPDDLAVKMDRCSMGNGLELRSPFLDTEVIELLDGVPGHEKVGLLRPKPLLRRACRELLPDRVWRRPKHGFGVPVDSWFMGPLRELVQDELLDPGARIGQVLDGDALKTIWRRQERGQARSGALLWTLLTMERWLRALERGGLVAPSESPGAAVELEL